MRQSSIRLPATALLPTPFIQGFLPGLSHSRAGTTTPFAIEVVSADTHPVAPTEVEAYYEYPSQLAKVSRAPTDGDSRANFVDIYTQPPASVTLILGRHVADSYPVKSEIVVDELDGCTS